MASGGRPAHQRPLVFVHIPRTGGTTLTLIVNRQFPSHLIFAFDGADMEGSLDRYRALPPERRGALRLISGHVAFGVHELIGRSADYVTMLRDPVERVISMYEYILRRRDHPLHGQVIGMDLGEYVQSGVHPDARNGQCRWLSGHALRSGDDEHGRPPRDRPALLEDAWSNVQRSFVAVGLTERFDESLLLYRQRLGWRRLAYRRENASLGRSPAAAFSAGALQAVREHNLLDIELYGRARAKFERDMAAVPGRAEQLRELRAVNARRGQWGGARGRLSDLRCDARRWIARWEAQAR